MTFSLAIVLAVLALAGPAVAAVILAVQLNRRSSHR